MPEVDTFCPYKPHLSPLKTCQPLQLEQGAEGGEEGGWLKMEDGEAERADLIKVRGSQSRVLCSPVYGKRGRGALGPPVRGGAR